MPVDLTAQRLHELLAPLWEREPELKPKQGQSHLSYCLRTHTAHQGDFYWAHPTGFSDHVWETTATQLCESQMVRWLAGQGDAESLYIRCSSGRWDVKPIHQSHFESAPTLVQALASACSAVLDAKESA